MKKLTLSVTFWIITFASLCQTSQNPVYLNYNSTISKASYISSTGSTGNQPTMLFHLPYVGTTGNAVFEWDADDAGTRAAIYQFKASGDSIFKVKGWNDGKNSELWFGDENSNKFFISDEGEVGIGTSTPNHPLEIRGKALLSNVGGETLLLNPDGVNRQGIISSNFKLAFIADKVNSLGSDKKIIFGAGGETPEDANFETYMMINQGKVAIGTTDFSGDYKLRVAGSIGAREIKVEAFPNWPDFVFEKDYKLRTLEEIEEHIQENNHLPEIPSATEVANEGINLGEMDAKLLQKIEELTLYLIEQNKRMNTLEAKNAELESEILSLKSE